MFACAALHTQLLAPVTYRVVHVRLVDDRPRLRSGGLCTVSRVCDLVERPSFVREHVPNRVDEGAATGVQSRSDAGQRSASTTGQHDEHGDPAHLLPAPNSPTNATRVRSGSWPDATSLSLRRDASEEHARSEPGT